MLDDRLIDIVDKKKSSYLVVGPPGSGKTYSLLELVNHLINKKKVNPEEILIFCFNRRWSKLIREKTAFLVKKSILEIPIETFYSFCTHFIGESRVFLYGYGSEDKKFLKINNGGNPFKDIKILNSVQQWKILKEVIEKLDESQYPQTYKYVNSNSFIKNSYVQEVFDFILRAQENLFTPEELLGKLTPFFNPLLSELAGIYLRYVEELREKHFYNYGMLLQDTVSILKSRKEIRERYKKKYRYIIVDELHELNKAQFEIINHISDSNCIFFGNDDQSIYAFRGSTINIIKSVYSMLNPENIIFLNKNYRSSPLINEVSKEFTSLVRNRMPKDIAASKSQPRGELHVKEFHTLFEEANYICRKIKFLYLSKNINLEDMAIIIKGTGYEAHIIESALLQNGIPFLRRNTRSLLENRLVKYLINFLRLIVAVKDLENLRTGSNRDIAKNSSIFNFKGKVYKSDRELLYGFDILIENIMLSDAVNLEPLYFKKIKNAYMDGNIKGGEPPGLWDYLKNQYGRKNRKNGLRGESLKINKFISEVYRLIGHLDGKDVFDFLLELIRNKKTGIIRLLSGANNEVYKKNQWSILSDFLSNVKDFSINNTPSDVRSYVNFIDYVIESKFTEEIEESTKDIIQRGSVSILSFHQCKGLEFKAVFIPFINKNYLPAKFYFTQTFDGQIFNSLNGARRLKPGELKREHIYGEMRLFYNGITRAEDYLYISSSGRRKSVFFEKVKDIYKNLDSRFKIVDELEFDKYRKPEEKSSAKKPFNNLEKFKGSMLIDFDLNNMWLVRKKALVAAARMSGNLKFDREVYLDKIIFLKCFYPPEKWWSFIKPTKNNKNPFILFPQSFSYSGISSFLDCPFKYKIMYYFGLKGEESLSLTIGRIYHRIIGLFFSSRNEAEFRWEILEGIINNVFNEFDFEYSFLKRDFKEKAIADFKNFFENNMPSNPARSITEKEFSFNLYGEKIRGRIDQINFLDDKNIEIIEYKSGSSSYSTKELKEELQLKLYRLALDISEDLRDFKYMGVKMKYIFPADLKKTVLVMPDEYYKEDEVKDTISGIITKIREEKFSTGPGNYNSCLNCGFKVLCPRYYGKRD
jgi:superfamily I DNA/RNA helicase/CRISPR/Cas system-associated exonuclease Cas4 (RecB family)